MCKVEWCNNVPNRSGKGYCRTHYDQMRKYGRILNKRTIRNPNDIINKDNYSEMVLRNIKGEEVARVKIDTEDIHKVRKYKWSLHNNGYVRSFTRNKPIYLHRFVTGAIKGQEIDHINLNKLDNRKQNLRFCKHLQNCWNRKSRNRGVRKSNRNLTKPYYAVITIDGQTKHLGYFLTKEEARKARMKAEETYHKEFQCIV